MFRSYTKVYDQIYIYVTNAEYVGTIGNINCVHNYLAV